MRTSWLKVRPLFVQYRVNLQTANNTTWSGLIPERIHCSNSCLISRRTGGEIRVTSQHSIFTHSKPSRTCLTYSGYACRIRVCPELHSRRPFWRSREGVTTFGAGRTHTVRNDSPSQRDYVI